MILPKDNNGFVAQVDGICSIRKIGTGSDVGAISMTGEVTLSPDDYIEVYIKSTLSTTVTFVRTSINICERN